MKTYSIIPLSARDIKKQMVSNGIKVLRCKQNGAGILVTVKHEYKESVDIFFNTHELTSSRVTAPFIVSGGSDYADYCTIFKHVSL